MRVRAEANTDGSVLEEYGGGRWPHKTSYDRGELAQNGNYLEGEGILKRHGICGDPVQTGEEGSNSYGGPNSDYPVLGHHDAGSTIAMKIRVSTWHYGHVEFFLCKSGTAEVVTQECSN